jgi:uncharacterized protein YciI
MTRSAASYTPSSYVVICRDGPNGPAARLAATAAHLAYIETVLGELNIAGPLYDPGGTQMIGSVYSFNTTSLQRAQQLIENDPYYRAGTFASVEYFPHLPAAGQYIGGKIW